MSDINEKLMHFNEVILKDAASERDKLLEQVRSYTEECIAAEKKKFEEQADLFFKKETALIENEKNSIISKAVIGCRQLLVKTREEIVEAVFNDTRNMLIDYTQKDEYLSYLLHQVELSCSLAGDGEMTVFLTGKDMDKYADALADIKMKVPQDIVFERTEDNIIGGCKVVSRTGGIIVENTLMSKLTAKRDSIIEICQLEIE